VQKHDGIFSKSKQGKKKKRKTGYCAYAPLFKQIDQK
jgi:hypothetical protein